MNFSYRHYLRMEDALPFEEACEIHDAILSNLSSRDPNLEEIWWDTIRAAVNYVEIRGMWNFIGPEQRAQADLYRTGLHDTFIFKINSLSVAMEGLGLDVSWRTKLGNDRVRQGDFACFLNFIFSLRAR